METLEVNNLLANAGDIRDMGSIPGIEDPLKKEMATHSSILAWRIPWTVQYSCLENPMDRGTRWATIHAGHKEPDMTEAS